jgi:hypothetical protein
MRAELHMDDGATHAARERLTDVHEHNGTWCLTTETGTIILFLNDYEMAQVRAAIEKVAA